MNDEIYTQQDMDIAKNAMDKFKRDADDAKRVVFALVKLAGGSVEIPLNLLMETSGTVTVYNDENKFCITIKG